MKALWHHPDQRARLTVDDKILSNDCGIGAELRLPRAIAHDKNFRRPRRAIFVTNSPPQKSGHAVEIECVRSHHRLSELKYPRPLLHYGSAPAVPDHTVKDLIVFLQVNQVGPTDENA